MILRVGVHNGTCVTSSDGDGSSGRSRRSGSSSDSRGGGGSNKWTTVDLREVQEKYFLITFFGSLLFFKSPFFDEKSFFFLFLTL